MSTNSGATGPDRPIARIPHAFGLELPCIQEAIRCTERAEKRLTNLALDSSGLVPQNTSVVIFGSFARDEFTPGSDLDWTFLIDGPADPQHFRLANDIRRIYQQEGFAEPGATMTFGTMASSHELIHHIGLTADTNPNFTRRMLLLLESKPVAGQLVHDRVVKGILDRYLVSERNVTWDSTAPRMPRFLLNDIVRFWRTMAVDYAAKTWQQDDQTNCLQKSVS